MIRKLLTRRILLTAMIFIVTMLVSLMANVSANAEYKKTDIKLETANTNDVFRTQMTDLVLKASDINDLYTMQVELCYDPGRLSLTQSGIKNLAWNNQNGYSAIKLDASAGRVNIIYSQKGKKPGVSGNKDLIGLKFETLRIGKATVEVSNIKLIDSYGNAINTKTSAVSKEVDVKPNPLIVELTGEMGQDGWYVSPVTVEITDIDAERISYTLNGIQNNYVQPITISEIGINNLKVRTDDGYGYIKEKENVLKIDYEGPVLKVNNQNYAWQNSDIFILPEFSDGKGSGIKQSYYQWTDSTDEPSL